MSQRPLLPLISVHISQMKKGRFNKATVSKVAQLLTNRSGIGSPSFVAAQVQHGHSFPGETNSNLNVTDVELKCNNVNLAETISFLYGRQQLALKTHPDHKLTEGQQSHMAILLQITGVGGWLSGED